MCLTLIQFAFSDCQGIVSRSDSFLPIRTLNGIPPFASLWFPRGFNTLLHRIWNSNAKKGSGNQENRGVKSARFNLVGFLRQSCWAKVRSFDCLHLQFCCRLLLLQNFDLKSWKYKRENVAKWSRENEIWCTFWVSFSGRNFVRKAVCSRII